MNENEVMNYEVNEETNNEVETEETGSNGGLLLAGFGLLCAGAGVLAHKYVPKAVNGLKSKAAEVKAAHAEKKASKKAKKEETETDE